eukprot:5556124-Pyramimonas_sp.AAC.1
MVDEGVDGPHDVVGLREHPLGAVEHGVRRGPLLPEVDHGVRHEALHRLREKLVVADVADVQRNFLACAERSTSDEEVNSHAHTNTQTHKHTRTHKHTHTEPPALAKLSPPGDPPEALLRPP